MQIAPEEWAAKQVVQHGLAAALFHEEVGLVQIALGATSRRELTSLEDLAERWSQVQRIWGSSLVARLVSSMHL